MSVLIHNKDTTCVVWDIFNSIIERIFPLLLPTKSYYNTGNLIFWGGYGLTNEQVEDFSELDTIVIEATGRRIKFLVQNQGFSQSQLAKLLGRDTKTISNYYCGKSLPDKKDLIVLSRVLGKSYDEILVFKGDVEGYQRIDQYSIEYDDEVENISDAINRSRTESKLFNPYSKGYANIRTLEEAGYCLLFFSDRAELDIRNRMMDELLSGKGVHSHYMQHIYEFYIWRKLTEEQKAMCKAQFAYGRGETEEGPSISAWIELVNKRKEQEVSYETD
jgi:transcriptional regulator with XRE-family HTH domain